MMILEAQYAESLKLLRSMHYHNLTPDRTGVGTYRKQHQYFEIDPNYDFPAIKGKMVHPQKAYVELLWMLSGQTNTKFLNTNGVKYWDEWADADGNLGPVYGHQMRNFNGIDQLKNVIETIRTNPYSRQNVMSLWNPNDLQAMRLISCHVLYQFTVMKNPLSFVNHEAKDSLHLHIYQRSSDSFLGMPYDFMLAGFMQAIIAHICGLDLGLIHYTIGDYHMYRNHDIAVTTYLDNFDNDPANLIPQKAVCQILTPENMAGSGNVDEFLKFSIDQGCNNFAIAPLKRYPAIPAPVAV